jgi:hypothetical protein
MKLLALTMLLTILQASPPVPRKTANNAAQARANINANSQNEQTPTRDSVTAVKTEANRPTQGNGDQKSDNNAEHTVGVSKLPPVSITKDWGGLGRVGL